MLELKNLEDELEEIIFSRETDIEKLKIEIENMKIIEKDLFEYNNTANNPLTLSKMKNNLNNIQEINVNFEYYKYYQLLSHIENEKEYFTKLDHIKKIVFIFLFK